MQNKGFVKVIAVLLSLICLMYLSFSYPTHKYEQQAEQMTAQGKDGAAYLDSMRNETVWLGKTLKDCEALQIGLGLDLKGGMNVVLEVSVPDVVKNLAGESAKDVKFKEAYNKAIAETKSGDVDFVDAFVKAYASANGKNKLGGIFASKLGEKNITYNSTDGDVKKVLNEEVNAAVENSNKVVRSRIDRFGVAQPNIQILRGKGQIGQIMVEMPGIKEPERVRKLLQGSANLEFWETYTLAEVQSSLLSLDKRLAGTDKDTAAADTTKAAAAKKSAAADQHPLLSKLAQIQGMQPNNCVVGYATAKDTAAINAMINSEAAKAVLPADLRLAWGVKSASGMKANVFELYALRAINGQPSMQGDVIADAKDEFEQQYHRPIVSMTMTTSGARDWASLTKKNLKKCVAIVLDGYVYSAPVVQSEITGGNSQISGNFTTDDTRDLANVLKSGKMPAPTKIVQEETVGPSLGAASIQAGFTACVVAFVLLMIFMCCFYGFIPGMVANLALILNFFFTFGILTSFQAALTMSGIAGMVLSLGMAVDANVLIYERTKEELKAGKQLKTALAEGYGNAFSAIFDSNLTSIITAVILYNFGTGPIRGFATTMIIGLFASFLTAVFLTRIVYEALLAKDKMKNVTFVTNITKDLLKNPKVNFLGARKIGYLIPLGIILLGAISMMTIGLNKGIDFTGGRNYIVRFDKEVHTDEVRDLLEPQLDGAVSVITIGTSDQVRISTNYKIDVQDPSIDQEIENKMYEGLKPLLKEGTTLDQFIGEYVKSSQKVGPSMADDIKNAAFLAVIFSMICMAAYILLRFRDISFSVGAFASVATTTLCIISFYTLLWKLLPFSMEVDQTFIAAILTIIGYSINDTVVVFDRIRETIHIYPNRDRYQVINDALNSTLCRTFNTSLTTLVVVICIFILGGSTIRSFTFAILLGIVIGTYSTLFVATPIAYELQKKKIKKQNAKQGK